MKLWRRLIFSDEGNAAVLVALAMVVFAGFASLVTDAGLIYLNRARMANALDSAVLAAAQDLPAKPDVSLGVADQYAGLNGLSDEEAQFVLDNENRRIGGAATRQLTLGFARLLGFDKAKVKAQSNAKVIPVSSVYGVVPFGVLEGDFNYGEEIILKQGSGDNLYHGWFGALILGRNGADPYRDNIKYGYPGEIKVGDIISIESGNMSGPTKNGVEYRINMCKHTPSCSYYQYHKGCPRIFLVPVVHIEQVNWGEHPCTVKVVGFAAFFTDEYAGQGIENKVKGKFMRYVISAKGDENISDSGLYTVKLCD